MHDKTLSPDFYNRPDALQVAKDLLGKIMLTTIGGIRTGGIIVETEAYMAPDDLACHAHSNRRTPRTELMYARPGLAYVYKCYGIHDLFNTVTAEEGVAHVVLVRAVEPFENIEIMAGRRKMKPANKSITNGPGKLTQALGITSGFNGIDLTNPKSPLVILDHTSISEENIIAGPRVGMSHHTKHCGHYPWRFRIKDNPWSSKPNLVQYNW